jgi:hypothetical protein
VLVSLGGPIGLSTREARRKNLQNLAKKVLSGMHFYSTGEARSQTFSSAKYPRHIGVCSLVSVALKSKISFSSTSSKTKSYMLRKRGVTRVQTLLIFCTRAYDTLHWPSYAQNASACNRCAGCHMHTLWRRTCTSSAPMSLRYHLNRTCGML